MLASTWSLDVRTTAVLSQANNGVARLHRLLDTPLSTLGKAALAGCAIALAILAWAPAQAMTRTPLGGHAEHFVAYLGTAMVFGLASRKWPSYAIQCFLLMGYAAVLECGQVYPPGRQASFQDFAYSSSGVLIGTTLVWIARTCWVRVKILRPTFVE